MKVLIIKLSAIGDVIHTIPFLETLKLNFPDWIIHWVVEEASFPLIETHPMLEKVMVLERRKWQRLRELKRMREFLQNLRKEPYDLVIDLQGLLKSGVICGLARAERKIGPSFVRECAHIFYTEPPILLDMEKHALERTLDLAYKLGLSPVKWSGKIYVPGCERDRVLLFLQGNKIRPKQYVCINPMAKGSSKLWILERFSKVADRIIKEMGLPVIFTGSQEDRPFIRGILDQMETRALNLAGNTTLRELAILYEYSSLLLCTDTGPMHLAAAMGCPVCAIFGPTSPLRTGPYGQGHKIITANVPCRPCFKRACNDMVCMSKISVDDVYNGIVEILNRRLS